MAPEKKSLKFLKKYKLQILFILAISLGFIFRIYSLSTMNFYYDEAAYAIFARDFVEKNISPWKSTAIQPPMFTWINSIPVSMLGTSEFSVRLSSVIFGTLTIVLVYLLAKFWFGQNSAILAAFITAVLPLHVIYSRLAFNDVTQTFFVLSSIIAMEFAISRKLKIFRNLKIKIFPSKCNLKNVNSLVLVVLSGFLFGISYLIKYNSIVVMGLYWIFVLGYSLIKWDKFIFKRYLFYAAIFAFTSAAFVTTVIFITGGIPHLVYLINSTIFWIAFQNTTYNNPFYYYILVLFDALSPIAYALFAVVLIYFFVYKKRNRNDNLLLFLILFYILAISLQPRRFSRYLIFIVPFIAIIISRFLTIVFDNFKYTRKNNFRIFAILLFFFSIIFWSIYEVKMDINFSAWGEAGKFIKANYPLSTTIHGSVYRYRLINYYLSDNPDYSESVKTLKRGDLILFSDLNGSSKMLPNLGNSPFEDKSTFLETNRAEYSQDFMDYVLRHGKFAKAFNYKGKPALWVYEIVREEAYNDKEKNEDIKMQKLSKIWSLVCKRWHDESMLKEIMERLLSKEQIEAVKIKCQTKLY